jgi:hypothetical protein
MSGKQAKILSADHIDDLLFLAKHSRHPLRNRLVVLLSVKAGLRAAEIAKLTWEMVLGPDGGVGHVIELQDRIAKKRGGLSIPLHPDLRETLVAVRRETPGNDTVIRSERGGGMTPLSIVVWFNRAYKSLGFAGCSSSGRPRSFGALPAARCGFFIAVRTPFPPGDEQRYATFGSRYHDLVSDHERPLRAGSGYRLISFSQNLISLRSARNPLRAQTQLI